MSAAGSGLCALAQTSYTVRLELIGGADLQIDAIGFHGTVGTDSATWGEIKELYQ
jgi:hypothetical protein